MSFLDMKEEEIKKAVYEMARSELGLQDLRPQGVLKGIIETCARLAAWLYTTFLHPLKKQSCVATATGTFLDSWGTLLDVKRKSAQRATGAVTITVNQNTTILKGQRITIRGTALVFLTTEDVSISQEQKTALVPVQAAETGARFSVFDVVVARSVFLNPLISNVKAVAFEKGWNKGAVTGTDEETDKLYHDRIMARWSRNAAGDVPLLYKAEAQSIDGVVEAKVFRTPKGTFGSLRVVCRGVNNTAPDGDVLQKVRERFDTVGLIARSIHVEAVKLLEVKVRLSYKGALSVEKAKERIIVYCNKLSIGTRYTIQDLYNLFDDLRNVQFRDPVVDDALLPDDAVYRFNITVTKGTA